VQHLATCALQRRVYAPCNEHSTRKPLTNAPHLWTCRAYAQHGVHNSIRWPVLTGYSRAWLFGPTDNLTRPRKAAPPLRTAETPQQLQAAFRPLLPILSACAPGRTLLRSPAPADLQGTSI